jgi:hypothetical protein
LPNINPMELSYQKEVVERAAQAEANKFDARKRCPDVICKEMIEADEDSLKELQRQPPESVVTGRLRQTGAAIVRAAGAGVAIVSGLTWIRWVILNTNDLLLATLLAAMVHVTTVGLHYWVWRSQDRSRQRALGMITIGLVVSGLGLVAAVAQRFGVEPPISAGDLNTLLAGDDNRWVMIPADLVGVCGSVLLLAWADDIGKSLHERIRDLKLRIAINMASARTHQLRRQIRIDRAVNRAHRTVLKAYGRLI